MDADKPNYPNSYDAVVPLLRPGGLLMADNVLWSGKVLDRKDSSDHAIMAFNEGAPDTGGWRRFC